jgi:hypothetical protein
LAVADSTPGEASIGWPPRSRQPLTVHFGLLVRRCGDVVDSNARLARAPSVATGAVIRRGNIDPERGWIRVALARQDRATGATATLWSLPAAAPAGSTASTRVVASTRMAGTDCGPTTAPSPAPTLRRWRSNSV